MSSYSTIKFLTEVGGFMAVGAISKFLFAPQQKEYDNFAKASEDIVEQSHSLSIELAEIIKRLDGIHNPKILGAIMHDSELSSKRQRNIATRDLDEFSRNIMLGHDNIEFPEDDDKLMPDSPSHKVIEKYRLISAPDLDKIATAAAIRSRVRQRGRRAKLAKEDLVADAMIETIDAISDTSFLVSNLTETFQKQHERLHRCLEKKAAEMISPAEAFRNTATLLSFNVVGYGAFCFAMDKYWPRTPNAIVPKLIPNPKLLSIAVPFIVLLHYTINRLAVNMSSSVDNSMLIVAEDKSIYSTYFNPTDNTPQIVVYEESDLNDAFDSFFAILGYDADDSEKANEKMEKPYEIPLVWPLATLRDPFTSERLSMNLLIKPLYDEYMFRVLLMTRLAACGGIASAILASSLIYASEMLDSIYDLRAMMHHLNVVDAHNLNLIAGMTLSFLYYTTGSVFPSVMYNAFNSGYYMFMEYQCRGDIIKEASASYHKNITVPLSFFTIYPYYLPLIVSTFGLFPPVTGILDYPSKPTAEVKQLTETLIGVYGTQPLKKDAKNGKDESKSYSSTKKDIVVSPEQAYDIIQSLQHATSERQGFTPRKHVCGFMKAEYASKTVKLEHCKHYSYVRALPPSKLDILRGELLQNYLHAMFPKGLSALELVRLVTAFLLFEAGNDTKARNLQRLGKDMIKWETNATSSNEGKKDDSKIDEEFLDLIDNMYKTRLNKLLIEATLFGVWRSSTFVDDLAGRKTVPEDVKRFKAELLEWMTYANQRATNQSLQAYGLTPLRFEKLLKMYDQKHAWKRQDKGKVGVKGEVGGEGVEGGEESGPASKLCQQWESYFAGEMYEKKIYAIVDPFGGGRGEHR